MFEMKLKYSMFISISVLDKQQVQILTVDNVMCIISIA